MANYLVDTNALLRAAQEEAAEHLTAVAAISSLEQRGESLFLTPQVLIEFWAVATRPTAVNGLGWEPELVGAEIERLLNQFPLLVDTPDVFAHWLQLVTAHDVKGKRVHDTRLVAVMLARGITHLLTFNIEDFKRYAGITLVHPNDAQ